MTRSDLLREWTRAADSPIRLASHEHNGGTRILRRGYSFTDGIVPETGTMDGGLRSARQAAGGLIGLVLQCAVWAGRKLGGETEKIWRRGVAVSDARLANAAMMWGAFLIFVFGDCELDLDRYELRRAGLLRPVEPQVFDLLAVLIRERHRVVPKEELLDTVWGNRFVSESALTSRVKAARQAIGDDGRTQRIIRTARGRGYQFAASVDEAAARSGRQRLAGPAGPGDPVLYDQ